MRTRSQRRGLTSRRPLLGRWTRHALRVGPDDLMPDARPDRDRRKDAVAELLGSRHSPCTLCATPPRAFEACCKFSSLGPRADTRCGGGLHRAHCLLLVCDTCFMYIEYCTVVSVRLLSLPVRLFYFFIFATHTSAPRQVGVCKAQRPLLRNSYVALLPTSLVSMHRTGQRTPRAPLLS